MFFTGQGWEGEVTFLRKVPEHAHKAKMVDNRCVFVHLGQGEGMSASALNKGVSMHMAHAHLHTLPPLTHTRLHTTDSIHARTHTSIHTCTHTRTHIHTHTHTRIHTLSHT